MRGAAQNYSVDQAAGLAGKVLPDFIGNGDREGCPRLVEVYINIPVVERLQFIAAGRQGLSCTALNEAAVCWLCNSKTLHSITEVPTHSTSDAETAFAGVHSASVKHVPVTVPSPLQASEMAARSVMATMLPLMSKPSGSAARGGGLPAQPEGRGKVTAGRAVGPVGPGGDEHEYPLLHLHALQRGPIGVGRSRATLSGMFM